MTSQWSHNHINFALCLATADCLSQDFELAAKIRQLYIIVSIFALFDPVPTGSRRQTANIQLCTIFESVHTANLRLTRPPEKSLHASGNRANIKLLLDEVEHHIMNYQNRGLCYLPKPKAEADNTDTRF